MLQTRGMRITTLLLVPVLAALTGCERQPVAVPTLPPPGPVPAVKLDTPEDAARTALTCIQTELRAVAHEDEQTAEQCREQLVRVAAARTIEQTFAKMPQFKMVVGDEMLEGYVANWGSTISYYAQDLHFDRMRRGAAAESQVLVLVPASGAEDDALIQLTCVRETENTWRISRIEFATEPVATQPAPTTAPAPARQP